MLGKILKERMNKFNINVKELAKESFVSEEIILRFLKGRYDKKEDEFNLALISSVLYCEDNYFFDENVRKQDLINALNTEKCNPKTLGKIQSFVSDFEWVSSLLEGDNKHKNDS